MKIRIRKKSYKIKILEKKNTETNNFKTRTQN